MEPYANSARTVCGAATPYRRAAWDATPTRLVALLSGRPDVQVDNNGDGIVDATDIQNILATNLFGQDAYAALAASAAVPEPSTVTLAIIAIVGLATCVPRRRRV